MPPDLPRLPSRRPRDTSDANAATYAALIGLSLLALALLAMISLVLPQVRGLIFVLLGSVGFFAIHYVIWGRLLGRIRDEELEAEQDRPELRRDGET
jgi:hypothetical protein